ncbi:hypothetical protein [Palleronia caenipelagi]|uniref:Uncharacterized protein n=1 Tax=Palleronia caenipelagi TaxID=2489174 RepID=A0A547Q9C1_9RHOB|nr:hypothetical protein [Palleronia caenipelagi]TRD22954.1 hypothetical protein FEV53_01965 [Palleronia caenipelagi]
MRYWAFFSDLEATCQGPNSGWLRALNVAEAFDLLGGDDFSIIELPDDQGFPTEAVGEIYWEQPQKDGCD